MKPNCLFGKSYFQSSLVLLFVLFFDNRSLAGRGVEVEIRPPEMFECNLALLGNNFDVADSTYVKIGPEHLLVGKKQGGDLAVMDIETGRERSCSGVQN